MKPLSLSRPHLVIMVGIPGAGKSYFAEHFGNTFHAPVINTGRIRQSLGQDVSEETVEQTAKLMLEELVKTNATIVYDGTSDTRASRLELSRFAHSVNYLPVFVWVQTDSIEAARRATNPRKADGYLTDEEFEKAVRRFKVPVATEKPVVISGKHTYVSQLKNVLKYLAAVRENAAVQPPAPRAGSRPRRRTIIR